MGPYLGLQIAKFSLYLGLQIATYLDELVFCLTMNKSVLTPEVRVSDMSEHDMLKRKALDKMEDWLEHKTTQALLVTGARQIGKTYLIREFARAHWKNVVELNLLENADAREAIGTAHSSRELFLRISAFADAPLVPGQTVIFIDEIQEATEAVTAIKFLAERNDFDYILSGSMFGVELKSVRSLPVGYLTTITMYPLDFEEFCWANNVADEAIASVKDCFKQQNAVDEYVHRRMTELFHRYLISGGMPEPVKAFVKTDSVEAVRLQQNAIVEQYRYDISKYAGDRQRVVRRIFDLIPSEISSQDKRFKVASIEGNSHTDRYMDDFMWLVDANAAIAVYNVKEPRYPLEVSVESRKMKLFASDVGILTYQCGMDVVRDIALTRTDINFGAIYENAVAQELTAHGFAPRYFKNRKIGELDFVVQWPYDRILPIEVKSGKDYKRHSALNNILKPETNYGISRAVVLHEGNVEVDGKIVYLPIYMVFCLEAQGQTDYWQ
jgi:predicted AAA+ superfamily ATPase